MPKRSPAVQLDRAIDALLVSLPPEPEQQNPSPALAQLMPIARALRNLPRPEFKAALRSDLQRRTTMNDATAPAPESSAKPHFRRPNFPNIAPYILVNGAAKFMDFLIAAFDGTERMRVPKPGGSIMHAEVAIGDSVIELSDANEQYPARPMTTHLYVPDSDVTYAKAMQAGASSVYPVADQHWGDRQGCVMDPFGNRWYIATPKGWNPGEAGIRAVQPFLHLRDAHTFIPFVEAAFGAEATGVAKSPEGHVLHATIEIGGATFEIDEAHGEFQPTPAYLHVYVTDTDALYAKAIGAGAVAVTPPNNAPYGDRAATVKDPFGNTWFLATYLGGSQS
ncbi:MAG: VOC family protein [Candidatus Acidiferrum sp.]